MGFVDKIKSFFVAAMNWISSANQKIEDVQEEIDSIVDDIQGEISEVESMLEKATEKKED